jgi:cytolysin-activating lysine-acyltransferase
MLGFLGKPKSGGWFPRSRVTEANGAINCLINVNAPDQKTCVSALAHFKQVVKEGDLRLHPIIARLLDKEILAK